jgi:hypothetical protein
MIEGVRQSAIEAGITDPEAFDAGVRDLHRPNSDCRVSPKQTVLEPLPSRGVPMTLQLLRKRRFSPM